mgnify:CR=1 FL=1
MNPGSVFISHSSKPPDFDLTKVLAGKLTRCGLNVWWDKDGLEGGHEFTAEIVEAIIRQHYFLFLLSKHSATSKWCRRELARASELGKTIIPFKAIQEEAEIARAAFYVLARVKGVHHPKSIGRCRH